MNRLNLHTFPPFCGHSCGCVGPRYFRLGPMRQAGDHVLLRIGAPHEQIQRNVRKAIIGGVSMCACCVEDSERINSPIGIENSYAFLIAGMGAARSESIQRSYFLGRVGRAAKNLDDLIRDEGPATQERRAPETEEPPNRRLELGVPNELIGVPASCQAARRTLCFAGHRGG